MYNTYIYICVNKHWCIESFSEHKQCVIGVIAGQTEHIVDTHEKYLHTPYLNKCKC